MVPCILVRIIKYWPIGASIGLLNKYCYKMFMVLEVFLRKPVNVIEVC